MRRHPTTAHWHLPDEPRPPLPGLERVSIPALMARPERFEHHLLVVARLGDVQIEAATASEPLPFAHRNLSDEYAVAMPTGDPLADGVPLRVFVSDPGSGQDLGRVNHRVGDLVLHPDGLVHWPGRLRPPYAPLAFPPGARRTGYTVVVCASRRVVAGERPLGASRERGDALKAYAGAPPLMLAALRDEPARLVGRVGDVALSLVVGERIAPARGGWLVVVAAPAGAAVAPGDLVRVPAGGSFEATGVRGLLVASESAEPAPPPDSWHAVAAPPFAPHEDAPAGALPVEIAGADISLRVAELDERDVVVSIGGGPGARVPRYWLARTLFRLALHEMRLGYVETYGGFFSDDGAGGDLELGVRDGGSIVVPRRQALAHIERLYRAVAPAGYTERLS